MIQHKIVALIALLFFTACSSTPDNETPIAPPAVPESTTTSVSAAVPAELAQHSTTLTEPPPSLAAPKISPPPPSHHESPKGTEPAIALGWLKNGNIRFTKGYFRKDGKSKSDIKRLVAGQYPHTIVLSCSDSRVPPEHAFDQALGEIFVIRVAGEALDSSVVASIEYAVEHLGARLLVVMGHTHCGAIKAALSSKPGQSVGSADLDALVADIKPRISSIAATSDVSEASSKNASGVAEDLVKRSKILSDKVHDGTLVIKSAMYWLNSGTVSWLE